MPNLYKQFMELQSPKPLLVGTVAFVVNGIATIDLQVEDACRCEARLKLTSACLCVVERLRARLQASPIQKGGVVARP